MPHIIVEHTQNIPVDIPKLLDAVHYKMAEHNTIDIHAIKTRAVPVQYAIVGDGKDRDHFVHITVKLLQGREDRLRQTIAESLHGMAQKHIPHSANITLSLDVVEMDKITYQK